MAGGPVRQHYSEVDFIPGSEIYEFGYSTRTVLDSCLAAWLIRGCTSDVLYRRCLAAWLIRGWQELSCTGGCPAACLIRGCTVQELYLIGGCPAACLIRGCTRAVLYRQLSTRMFNPVLYKSCPAQRAGLSTCMFNPWLYMICPVQMDCSYMFNRVQYKSCPVQSARLSAACLIRAGTRAVLSRRLSSSMDSHEGKLLSVPQLPITASSSAETLTGRLFLQREKTREINGHSPSPPQTPPPVDSKPELRVRIHEAKRITDPVIWIIKY
jgi:hypothetical protein